MLQNAIGPPDLTINHGRTFMVFDRKGDIRPDDAHGLFAEDTRFISSHQFRLNGCACELLTASTLTYFAYQAFFTNPELESDGSSMAPNSLGLVLSRTLGEGLHEDYDLTNYASVPVRLQLEIRLESDFADIFEVKTERLRRHGHLATSWDPTATTLTTSFAWERFARGVRVRADRNDSPMDYANGCLTFSFDLAPGASWHTCLYVEPVLANGEVLVTSYDCYQFEHADTPMDRKERHWRTEATSLRSSYPVLDQVWERSVEDLGAMRMYVQDVSEELWVPVAGLPWFVALFGRDSLLTAMQAIIVNPTLAWGALKRLSTYQAQQHDPGRDMEPGKILHELRVGPLATNGLIPHRPYFGTADASILFLITLSEAYGWSGDLDMVRSCLPAAEACLRWIDTEGDRDGDGFQEYATRAPDGYRNMGWKDAGDAIVDSEGRLVDPPIALVELQGYVFDAKRRMAAIFERLGQLDRAAELRTQAETLRRRVEEAFWIESEGTYGLCLDARKRLVSTVASNAGHLLWSGLPTVERARRVTARLLMPDMFSGWGIRTLSRLHPAYNPYEYQRGSVWPHDNSLIAKGMVRYGGHAAAAQVAKAILDAAACFQGYRLPELFAGLQRWEECSFPVQYSKANVPQAWAAGAVFQLVQALLGLEADAASTMLWAYPVLPDWLGDVRISGLHFGADRLEVDFRRDGTKLARIEVRGASVPLGVHLSDAAFRPSGL